MHAAFAFCAIVMVGSGTPDFMEPISPLPDNVPMQLPCPPAHEMQAGRLHYEMQAGRPSNDTQAEPLSHDTQAGRLRYDMQAERLNDGPDSPPLSNPQAAGTRPAEATNQGLSEANHGTSFRQAGTRPAQAMNQGVMRQQRMPMAPTDPGAFYREDLPLPPTMNYGSASPGSVTAGTGPRQDSAGVAQNSHHLPSQKAYDHYRPLPAASPYTLLGASTNNGTVNTYAAYVRPAQEQQRANQELERAANNAADQPAPTYPPVFLNSGPYYPNYGAAR